jgi:hypothetical protein
LSRYNVKLGDTKYDIYYECEYDDNNGVRYHVTVKWFDDKFDRKEIILSEDDLAYFFDDLRGEIKTRYGFIVSNMLDFKRIERFEDFIFKHVMNSKTEKSSFDTKETVTNTGEVETRIGEVLEKLEPQPVDTYDQR